MDINIQPEIVISFAALVATILGVCVAYLEYKVHKMDLFKEKIVRPLTCAKEYYIEGEKIHKKFSRVRIIAKTPGLLLASERDLTAFRQKYFQTINLRLNDRGDYHLKYLFDLSNFREELNEYNRCGNKMAVAQTKQMLAQAISHKNLDLRVADTKPLMGMIIGGESIATIGFKEPWSKNLAEGVLIRSPEIIRVLVIQFDAVFEKAYRVTDSKFVDSVTGNDVL
jgi:hypothetical protein